MSNPSSSVAALLERIDHVCRGRGDLTPPKLAKRLFGSGHALKELAEGNRDLSSRKVEWANEILDGIERAPSGADDNQASAA